MADSNQIITLITFFDPIKAHIVKTRLESEDIRCFVTDGNIFPTHSFFSDDGGIQLKVNTRDLSRAQKVIQSIPSHSTK
jgi:hypothetical protein